MSLRRGKKLYMHAKKCINLEGLYLKNNDNFGGASVKLRKATISFVTSVCPAAWNSAPTERIFIKFIFEYFSKVCPENSSFTKYNKNNGYFI